MISWSEFLAFHVNSQSMMNAPWPIFLDVAKVRIEFANVDTDGNGSISKDEFCSAITPMMNADPE